MFEPLNIALLSIHSCPFARIGSKDTGGMNVYIRELCRELNHRGHHIDIFTAAHQCGHCPRLMPENDTRLFHLTSRLKDDFSNLGFNKYLDSLAFEVDAMQKYNKYKYDIIHSHYWQSGAVGIRLQARWQIPHMTMFHTLSALKKPLHIANTDPECRQEQEYLVAQSCNRIIASTMKENDYLHGFYNVAMNKIDVVPCGINLDLFKPYDPYYCRQKLDLPQESEILLFVGRLEPLKGIEQLLRAFYLIKNSTNARLLIVGGDKSDQQYLYQLKQLTRYLNIENRTVFQGSVAQHELPLYYSAADICIVPSYYESFCLVILESLACGTPVISNDIGVAKEIITDNISGEVLPNNSPRIIAESILHMLRHGGKNRVSIDICSSQTYPYAWKNIAQMIEMEYINLSNSRLEQSLVG